MRRVGWTLTWGAVVAQWIRPLTLNHEIPSSNLVVAAIMSLGKALYPHCLVPWKGLKAIGPLVVIRHLLRQQLLLWWYLQQQRVRVRIMIGFLVQGMVRIKSRIRVRVRIRVMFNVSIYHRSNCCRSKCCHTFPLVACLFISSLLS